jgi:hypothetical protein
MAQNPTSKGIGTGSAQVFDYSRIDRAMANMFDTIGKKDAAAALKADEQQAKDEKAIAELSGKLGDYDVNNLRTVDVDSAVKMTNDSLKKYNGHWKEILNGDPKWSNMYNEDIGNIKKFMAGSINSKEQFKKLYESADSLDSGYSDERKKSIKEYYLKPGATYEEAVELGLTSQDTIVGNPLSRVDDAFRASGDELYDFVNKAYTAADGSNSTRREKVWKEDSEAIPAFKSTIASSTRLMSDMNIKYPNMSFDDQVKAFYDEYKSSRQLETKDNSYRAAQIDNSSNSTGGKPKFELAPFGAGKKGDITYAEGFKFSKTSNTAIQPFEVSTGKGTATSVKSILPSSLIYNKSSDKWELHGYDAKNIYNKELEKWEAVQGSATKIHIPENGQVMNDLKTRLGIPLTTSMTDYYKSVNGSNPGGNNDDLAAKAKALIKKHKGK